MHSTNRNCNDDTDGSWVIWVILACPIGLLITCFVIYFIAIHFGWHLPPTW